MNISVEGPLRGLFLCKLPPNSTVHVINNKDSILPQPFGREAKTVTTSEESGHIFFQLGGGLFKTENRDSCFFQVKTNKVMSFVSLSMEEKLPCLQKLTPVLTFKCVFLLCSNEGYGEGLQKLKLNS